MKRTDICLFVFYVKLSFLCYWKKKNSILVEYQYPNMYLSRSKEKSHEYLKRHDLSMIVYCLIED